MFNGNRHYVDWAIVHSYVKVAEGIAMGQNHSQQKICCGLPAVDDEIVPFGNFNDGND